MFDSKVMSSYDLNSEAFETYKYGPIAKFDLFTIDERPREQWITLNKKFGENEEIKVEATMFDASIPVKKSGNVSAADDVHSWKGNRDSGCISPVSVVLLTCLRREIMLLLTFYATVTEHLQSNILSPPLAHRPLLRDAAPRVVCSSLVTAMQLVTAGNPSVQATTTGTSATTPSHGLFVGHSWQPLGFRPPLLAHRPPFRVTGSSLVTAGTPRVQATTSSHGPHA
ncbi:hypothetical protein CQW23_11806 [Capsicum baccatum]|uniref:Uncharacterized protein n=1 Tax=Capsicum baccatum TaxID=33114 RepID=A0A2G2WQR5_CAPBA|nr:hypothetical protein CQW23_11806 [Capsicum baccatum]